MLRCHLSVSEARVSAHCSPQCRPKSIPQTSRIRRPTNSRHVILGKWPTWRTIIFDVFIFIFHSLHVSSTSCSSSGQTNCVNTTSGTLCRWPCRVEVGSSLPTSTRRGHRHRVTATRGCIDTICLSRWWAICARNMYRVKNINKYIGKNCASSWSFTKNHYVMHGQQNIKVSTWYRT